MSFIWSFIQPVFGKLLIGLVAVVTVLGVLARIKHAGRLQERVETQRRTIESVKRRQEVKHEVRKDLRDSGESAAERLRGKWARD